MSPSTPSPATRRYHLHDPVTPNSRSEPYPVRSRALSAACLGEPSMLAAISDRVGAGPYRRSTPALRLHGARQDTPQPCAIEQSP